MESIKNLHEIASMLDPKILVSPPRLVDVSKYASTNTTVEVSFVVSIPPEKGVKPLPQWLIEAARAEEDERLGRWRWPENPSYVVYSRDARGLEGVLVVDERDGYQREFESRSSAEHLPGSIPAQAAVAYFDAHPEPKPWHNAKPGEVWAVDAASLAGSGRQAMIVDSGVFVAPDFAFLVTDSAISGAYRIWPPEESS